MAFLRFFTALFCLTLLPASLVLAQSAPVIHLEDYKWKNRLLLVFAPAADNPAYERQQELIHKEKQGLQDRDLLVLSMAGHKKAESRQLREQFKVQQEEFTIILVGKDGTEKYRSTAPVAMQDIFRIIDRMPMRQQEMREQEKE